MPIDITESEDMRTSRRHLSPLLVAVTTSAALLALPGSGSAQSTASPTQPLTYQNPVSTPAAENFGSPTVIRGRDGFWYAFGPGNPLNAGQPRPMFPIMRSPDLVSWTYIGDVFTPETFPEWAAPNSNMWAPSIEYFDGQYRLYFTMRNIPGYDKVNTAIGVATAPTPAGPWTDSGAPLVPPSMWTPPDAPPRYRTIIDAEVFTTPDGTRYLFYGGFGGGVWGRQLSPDGMKTVGDEVQLTREQIYEGPYVVQRDGWYYLFVSSGHCCMGPATSYIVQVGRSRNPLGPYVDRQGQPLLADSPGGTHVVAPNGNTWMGTGHNAAVTDLAGQQWLTFNGIDRKRPYLREGTGENRRPLLIDRLDWIDGWPTVRGGAWASEEPTTAPTATGTVSDAFEGRSGLGDTWEPSSDWRIATEPAGGYVHTDAPAGERALDSARALAGDVRVRGAVRLGAAEGGSAGFVLAHHGEDGGIRVTIDRSAKALVVDVRKDGAQVTRSAQPLPASFRYDSWHDLVVEVRGRSVTASVSDAGLFDPVAVGTAELPTGLGAGPLGLLAGGTAADFDDMTAATLYTPHTELVPEPTPGPLDTVFSDEFDGQLGAGWSWVREPVAGIDGDALRFPVQQADLTGASNSASLLLRDAPDGEWIVETKVSVDFGDAKLSAFPQAGLVVYANDDNYLRLTTRAHGYERLGLFQTELPWDDRTVANAGPAGPVGESAWLRLYHRIDPVNGEHELRAAVSRDGSYWSWAATLTLPADADLRIGLGAHGAGEESLTAEFDHFRLYRL